MPHKATKQFILGSLASVEKLKGVAATCQNRAALALAALASASACAPSGNMSCMSWAGQST